MPDVPSQSDLQQVAAETQQAVAEIETKIAEQIAEVKNSGENEWEKIEARLLVLKTELIADVTSKLESLNVGGAALAAQVHEIQSKLSALWEKLESLGDTEEPPEQEETEEEPPPVEIIETQLEPAKTENGLRWI